MADDIERRLAFARDLIAAAGELSLTYSDRVGTLTVTSKGVQDVVSEADVAVEKLIKQRIAEAFPSDAFLGEETGHSDFPGSTGIWVVDPIDGTQPFVSGLSSWCISIAYVRAGVLEFGLVNAPANRELFVGGRGLPATKNGQPISLHPGTDLTDGLTYLGCAARIPADDIIPVFARLMRRRGMYLRNGSGALGICDVACGRLLGLVEPHIWSWDCLGGIAVLQAAGGVTNDYLADDGLTKGNWLVAATPATYDALVEVLRG
ncbi:inositol monophosphatase family protein [Microlunatus ginsengisoli]|uniref:Inositol monophosphatase n=1 Tax=Microlunatus ginsengisoli TaxID=363863 RepID=A0ABP6ZGN6_9ACTN